MLCVSIKSDSIGSLQHACGITILMSSISDADHIIIIPFLFSVLFTYTCTYDETKTDMI